MKSKRVHILTSAERCAEAIKQIRLIDNVAYEHYVPIMESMRHIQEHLRDLMTYAPKSTHEELRFMMDWSQRICELANRMEPGSFHIKMGHVRQNVWDKLIW